MRRRWAGARGRFRAGGALTWRRGNLRCTLVTQKQLERPARAVGMPGTDDETLRAKTGSPKRMGGNRRKYRMQKLLWERAAAP